MSATARWTVWLLATLAAAPVAAQAPPRMQAAVDTSALTLGGRIHLTLTVDHAPDATVAWPDSVPLGPFELLDARRSQRRAEDGRMRSTAVLTLTAFELGDLEIPSIGVTVTPAAGDTITLSSDPIPITVASVGPEENGDIRDVKAPLDVPRSWLVVAAWVLGLATVAAAAYLLYRRVRARPRAAAPAPPPAPRRPPHLVAYEALERLAASGMLERGEVKHYYIAASNIIRQYIEGRFAVPALELATHEVLGGLARALPAEQPAGFERFLQTCDLVKFAKYEPSPARSSELVPEARRLVEQTEPREPQAAPPADTGLAGAAGPPGPHTPVEGKAG